MGQTYTYKCLKCRRVEHFDTMTVHICTCGHPMIKQ